jgi:hypothetical protein
VAASRAIYAFGSHPDNKQERVLVGIKRNIACAQSRGVEFRLDEWFNVDETYRVLMEDCSEGTARTTSSPASP